MITPGFRYAKVVTTSDSAQNQYKCLFVGGAGTVKVTTVGGDVVTFTGVVAGSYVNIETTLVWATGTSATNIVGLR
jgi:hypothetical protein